MPTIVRRPRQFQGRRTFWTLPTHVQKGMGLIYRYEDASNYYRAYCDYAGARVVLQKVVAGIVTTLATAAWTRAATATLRAVYQGNRHRIYVDSVMYIDTTDASINTGIRSGLYGNWTPTGRPTADDFYTEGL